VKSGSKFYFPHSIGADRGSDVEHIVIVEFEHKKLAFAFTEVRVAQRFLLCLELFVRNVQQKHQPKWPPGCLRDESFGQFGMWKEVEADEQQETSE
jgi:hypothetical protein